MIPARKDLKFYPGDSFSFFFRVFKKNPDGTKTYQALEGTPRGQVKAQRGAVEPVLEEFTCTLGDQVAYPGSILATLTPTQTAALPATGVYDIQLEKSLTDISTYVTGKFDRDEDQVTS